MIGISLLLLGFLLVLGTIIALGSGVGYLLHWLLPDVELGMALLVGTLMSALALYVFVQLFRSFQEYHFTESLIGYEEDDEEVVVKVPQRSKRNRKR